MTEKLAAVLIQIIAMNLIIYALSVGTIALIGEEIPWKELSLLHLAFFIMQAELAGICFGISAFLRRGSAGVGLGIATVMYFLNIIANISKSAAFFKYISPFGYCEGADLVTDGHLNAAMTGTGIVIGAAGILAGYLRYRAKDIQ